MPGAEIITILPGEIIVEATNDDTNTAGLIARIRTSINSRLKESFPGALFHFEIKGASTL